MIYIFLYIYIYLYKFVKRIYHYFYQSCFILFAPRLELSNKSSDSIRQLDGRRGRVTTYISLPGATDASDAEGSQQTTTAAIDDGQTQQVLASTDAPAKHPGSGIAAV